MSVSCDWLSRTDNIVSEPGDQKKMMQSQDNQLSLLNSDASTLAEIWRAIRKYQTISAVDMDSFSVAVEKGFVLLTGHVSKKYHRELIAEIAMSLPDIHTVHNRLVVDSDLTIEIAESLAKDERTRHFILPVGCAHGWVRIGGVVPRRELQRAAEELAAQVPSVRGVLSRPRVIGEPFEVERQAFQPRIGTKIYDYSRQEGVVQQVVIQPCNRLVTHAVVAASDFYNGSLVSHEYVIPLQSIEVINPESLFVKRNEQPLKSFPALDELKYPSAPSDWQPPYPYALSDVRWPCESSERLTSGSSSH